MSISNPLYIVTGGLGFIGSHTVVELFKEGYSVAIIDNLSNSRVEVFDRIKTVATEAFIRRYNSTKNMGQLQLDIIDVLNIDALEKFFTGLQSKATRIHGVIHFAAKKSVSESIQMPIQYYRSNVCGLLNLIEVMEQNSVYSLVFSSSATVYGSRSQGDETGRCKENLVQHKVQNHPQSTMVHGCNGITNPYGRTKWMDEAILHDVCVSNTKWRICALRYFNPVGAHPSGLLGESPKQPPTNILPRIIEAMETNVHLKVYGQDYDTRDGSAVRDFIHVSKFE